MDTEEMQRGFGVRGGGLAAFLATISGALAASLLRWSLWWPHADVRQRWATISLVGATLVTLWTLVWVLRLRTPVGGVVLGPWAGALLAGATLGFDVLRSATLPYR